MLNFLTSSVLILLLLQTDTPFKSLDLGPFSVSIPKEWKYKKLRGIDSYVGRFECGNGTHLDFDYSTNGYASSLIASEEEFIDYYLQYGQDDTAFCEPGIVYTNKEHIEQTIQRLEKERPAGDTTPIVVREWPNPTKKLIKPTDSLQKLYPEADYIAILTYQNRSVRIPLLVPQQTKDHHIKVASQQPVYKKIIIPKDRKGMTGLCIVDSTKGFNFSLYGMNLSNQDQQDALKVFASIRFKD